MNKLHGGPHGGEEHDFGKLNKIALPIDGSKKKAIYELREHDPNTDEKVGVFVGVEP